MLLASFLLIVGSANAADIISPVQSIDVYTGDNIIGAADGSRIDGAVEIAVNGKNREDIIGGHLSAVNGGIVGLSNVDSEGNIVDPDFNAVVVNINGGNIKQAARSNNSNIGNSVIYGNILYNVNSGSIGIGSGYSADTTYLMPSGYYGQKGKFTSEVYGNVTLNIGSQNGSTSDVFIGYDDGKNANGFVVATGTSTVRGDVRVNMYSGSAGYVWSGSYGATINGDTHILIDKNAAVTNYVLGGGSNISDTFSCDVLGSTNVTVRGSVGGDIYGSHYDSSRLGLVGGNVNVAIDGGSVKGDVYGAIGNIKGDVYISATNGAAISGNINAGESDGADWTAGTTVGGSVLVSIGNAQVSGTIDGGNNVSGTKTINFGTGTENYIGNNAVIISNFDNVKVSSGSAVKFGAPIDVSLLEVASGSSVAIAEDSKFGELNIIFSEDFATGDTLTFYMTDVFGESSTIVLSAIESSETSLLVTNSHGEEFNASLAGDGSISVGAAIPEPSVCAAVLGAIALGIAACRRRK